MRRLAPDRLPSERQAGNDTPACAGCWNEDHASTWPLGAADQAIASQGAMKPGIGIGEWQRRRPVLAASIGFGRTSEQWK
jgi:hypothetical protein